MPRQTAYLVLTTVSKYRTIAGLLSGPNALLCTARLAGVPKRKTLMLARLRPTAGLLVARFLTVSFCLCVFAVSPLPQCVMLIAAHSAESACPCQEDGKTAEKELTPGFSVRRRLSAAKSAVRHGVETGGKLHKTLSKSHRLPVIVGHQLANDHCAPLII